jgi:hypothetical protein
VGQPSTIIEFGFDSVGLDDVFPLAEQYVESFWSSAVTYRLATPPINLLLRTTASLVHDR